MKKTNNLSEWIGWLKIGVVVVGIFAVTMVLLLIKTHSLQQELSSVNNDITYLQSLTKTSEENLTEKVEEKTAEVTEIENIINSTIDATIQETKIEQYEQTIDFLENEMVKYREFVEGEQEYLIRLISYCVAAVVAILTFLGFKTRKEIQGIIQEQYKNQVEDEFSKCIGGTGNKEYLSYCIERERTAKNKRMLFLTNLKREDGQFVKAFRKLDNSGYRVRFEERDLMGLEASDLESVIKSYAEKYQIIVYETNTSEYVTQNPSKIVYGTITKVCDEKKVYSVLYCEGRLDVQHTNYFYTVFANTGLTLMGHLLNIVNQ